MKLCLIKCAEAKGLKPVRTHAWSAPECELMKPIFEPQLASLMRVYLSLQNVEFMPQFA